MSKPAGTQAMRLHIDTLDDTFTGRIESPLGNHDVNGSVRDGMLSWQMKANKPIPITVNFSATIIGDTLNGSAKLGIRSEEHTSELQSLMRISYAVFCLKKKNKNPNTENNNNK